jgi:dTDP-glucose 4,6-dehydratase
MKILVTGWAGFIGSNFVRYILDETDHEIVGIDSHTYAARPLWALKKVQDGNGHRFRESYCNLANAEETRKTIALHKPEAVFHFAAESHVCNSITGPRAFADTNVMGTFNLLEALRNQGFKGVFSHISTDEVFGELGETGSFSEQTPYAPRSPYSATKAASDHLVMAFHHTYGLDTRITNCSNNFGPNQHAEKLIPRTIIKAFKKEPMTIHGSGKHVRDWIWVNDHCRGILAAMENGKSGQQYLLGGNNELTNEAVIFAIWDAIREMHISHKYFKLEMINNNDRPTDDARYAIDTTKAWKELSWKPQPEFFNSRLKETIEWYLKHELPLLS